MITPALMEVEVLPPKCVGQSLCSLAWLGLGRLALPVHAGEPDGICACNQLVFGDGVSSGHEVQELGKFAVRQRQTKRGLCNPSSAYAKVAK